MILEEVALRKESVDRNLDIGNATSTRPRSLSARRAWIEILFRPAKKNRPSSLSARRAWIEIVIGPLMFKVQPRRSPQGERG